MRRAISALPSVQQDDSLSSENLKTEKEKETDEYYFLFPFYHFLSVSFKLSAISCIVSIESPVICATTSNDKPSLIAFSATSRIALEISSLTAGSYGFLSLPRITRNGYPNRPKQLQQEGGHSLTLEELKNFAKGLPQDYKAVKLAFTLTWSNGQVEGQVNRLKMLKRQMYGQAGFKLLRRRILFRSG